MKSSIFTAINIVLNIISWDKHNKCIIFSNPLFVLTSMKNKKAGVPINS